MAFSVLKSERAWLSFVGSGERLKVVVHMIDSAEALPESLINNLLVKAALNGHQNQFTLFFFTHLVAVGLRPRALRC